MDNDSAHHADIALHMYLTGDYANLIDRNVDYLDKPHLLFWLCAFSYKIFGVTAFAYKFPSFLFTILGTYSTYRVGTLLYNSEVGKLAALIIASSFAYMLANSDVRMDAILTACVAFSTWQLIEFVDNKNLLNIAGAALGLALGFSTKGHIAVFVPAVTTLFYIFLKKDWNLFYDWRWIVLVILFGLFISPVVYCYYQQFNLHPEKNIRGTDHINGVKFILFNQSIERFEGSMGSDSKNDYFFFLHSFLWAFAPWSILSYMVVGIRVRNLFRRKTDSESPDKSEWATIGVFTVMAIIISVSRFKLPHYVNIIFPAAAIMTAAFLANRELKAKQVRAIFIIQIITAGLLLLLTAFINVWAFPVTRTWIMPGIVLLLSVIFYFVKSGTYTRLQKAVTISVATMAFVFFLLYGNFYPRLLKYQAGQSLAALTKGKVDPRDVYVRPDSYSASYAFCTVSLPRKFDDSLLQSGSKPWLLTEPEQFENFLKEGYKTGIVWSATHFGITRLSLKFLNPDTRNKECSKMMLVEVIGKK